MVCKDDRIWWNPINRCKVILLDIISRNYVGTLDFNENLPISQLRRDCASFYCQIWVETAANRFSKMWRWTLKKNPIEKFSFFLVEKIFWKKKFGKFLKISDFRKSKIYLRKSIFFNWKFRTFFDFFSTFLRTFFSKYFFDKKKWKIFDRIFLKVHLHFSKDRFKAIPALFREFKNPYSTRILYFPLM